LAAGVEAGLKQAQHEMRLRAAQAVAVVLTPTEIAAQTQQAQQGKVMQARQELFRITRTAGAGAAQARRRLA
jgi:hypothetical protein